MWVLGGKRKFSWQLPGAPWRHRRYPSGSPPAAAHSHNYHHYRRGDTRNFCLQLFSNLIFFFFFPFPDAFFSILFFSFLIIFARLFIVHHLEIRHRWQSTLLFIQPWDAINIHRWRAQVWHDINARHVGCSSRCAVSLHPKTAYQHCSLAA